jgi:hypothetical protein
LTSTTELEASRTNAKKEKRQRNRENMRKFQKKGKTSRKKMMRKTASADMRQVSVFYCFPKVMEESNHGQTHFLFFCPFRKRVNSLPSAFLHLLRAMEAPNCFLRYIVRIKLSLKYIHNILFVKKRLGAYRTGISM